MNESNENKREIILKSAAIFFSKYGFSKTTLEDIAGYMGMKKNSLYYYFPSKEALFKEVTREKIAYIFKKLNEAVSLKKTAAEKLKIYFETGRKIGIEQHDGSISVHAVIDIRSTLKSFYKDFNRQSIFLIDKIISEGVEKGEFKKCNHAEIAKSLLNLVESVRLREFFDSKAKYLNEIDFVESDKTISTLLNLIIEGLKVK